ncbi:MAG: barstar family protein [Atopobiaceae bacterium]|nr:barstar family protein [Atopobiaceae bacterium]
MPRPIRVELSERACATEKDAHELLAQELLFPRYYGANLDALEDCLSEIAEPTRIVVKRDRRNPKPWFGAMVEVIRESAQRSCYLGCTIRE